MNKLAIFGAGGHGKVVAEAAELVGWDRIDFFDAKWPNLQNCGVWPVVGDFSRLTETCQDYGGCIVAIGNNKLRLKFTNDLIEKDAELVSIFHPKAVVSSYAKVEPGTAVLAGAVINPFSLVGLGSIINANASVDHDCVLDKAVHICPGASIAGGVSLGQQVWVGIGASIKQETNVGHRSVIGAGAVVLNDIDEDLTVIGVPARPM